MLEYLDSMRTPMKVIGLTGGIGSGKSTVLATLHNLGAYAIDADELLHDTYRRGTEGWRRVVNIFGEAVLDANQEIDRKHLGSIVFADPQALTALNTALHPLGYEALQAKIESLESEKVKVAVLEAALLLEAGWDKLVSEVWVITAPQDLVKERLQNQRKLTPTEIQQRIGAQYSQDRKVQKANVVIKNDGNLQALSQQVFQLWQQRINGVNE